MADGRSCTPTELEPPGCELGGAGIGPDATSAALLHNRIDWPEIVLRDARAGARCMRLN